MAWIGRLVAKAAAGAIAAKRKQATLDPKDVDGTGSLLASKDTVETESSFLMSIERRIKNDLNKSTADIMSHLLVGVAQDVLEGFDEKAARKLSNAIQKAAQSPAALEEAITMLGVYVPGDRGMLKAWVDGLSAGVPNIELALTSQYTVHVSTLLPRWRSVYGYYYRQLIDNCKTKNKTLANTSVLTQSGMLYLEPSFPIDSVQRVHECHRRLRGVITFIDDYLAKKFLFGDKLSIRMDYRPFIHVMPCIQATCDGLFKDVLDEQQHIAILNAYFRLIEAPQFLMLEGIPPYSLIIDVATLPTPLGPVSPAKPAAAVRRVAAIDVPSGSSVGAVPLTVVPANPDEETQHGAPQAQPRPWKPACPECGTTLKFLPEYNVWFCSRCNDHYKI